MVEAAQTVHGRSIFRHAAFDTFQQHVHLCQNILHIKVWVHILRQTHGRLKQRKAVIPLNQRLEVLQMGRDLKFHFLMNSHQRKPRHLALTK